MIGQRVDADVFQPGWTDYRSRARYEVYDVTSQLVAASNVEAVVTGNGWYRRQLV